MVGCEAAGSHQRRRPAAIKAVATVGSTGWYRDFLVNEAGTWRVKKRVIVQDARAAKADTGSGPPLVCRPMAVGQRVAARIVIRVTAGPETGEKRPDAELELLVSRDVCQQRGKFNVVRQLSGRKRPEEGAQPAHKLVAGLGVSLGLALHVRAFRRSCDESRSSTGGARRHSSSRESAAPSRHCSWCCPRARPLRSSASRWACSACFSGERSLPTTPGCPSSRRTRRSTSCVGRSSCRATSGAAG